VLVGLRAGRRAVYVAGAALTWAVLIPGAFLAVLALIRTGACARRRVPLAAIASRAKGTFAPVELPEMEIGAPTRGNRKLEALLEAANGDHGLHAWWHMQQVTAERLGMSDHSWVHVRIVVNIALRIFRLLTRGGVEPAVVRDHGLGRRDAEVVIAAGCLLHDVGMSIHRTDHEEYSLFLAADRLPSLLGGVYDEPELTVVASEVLHTIIGHRRRGDPITVEAGVVRVADALDLAKGRSRIPFETRRPNIHSLSAAAIDEVRIEPGEDRAVQIEIAMNNSSGIFQVDELLATKLRGSGLEEHLEVVARIDAEHEKRLVPVFRI
jgi:metal-dependent HD superfamily phosphatase/phosphodiesterase